MKILATTETCTFPGHFPSLVFFRLYLLFSEILLLLYTQIEGCTISRSQFCLVVFLLAVGSLLGYATIQVIRMANRITTNCRLKTAAAAKH